MAAMLAALVALFGYGFRIRFWIHLFLFIAGVSLFLNASVDAERFLRGKPWMREHMSRRSSANKRGDTAAAPCIISNIITAIEGIEDTLSIWSENSWF